VQRARAACILNGENGVEFVEGFEGALLDELYDLTGDAFLREDDARLRAFFEKFNGDAGYGGADVHAVDKFLGFEDFFVNPGERAVAMGMAADVHFCGEPAANTKVGLAFDVFCVFASGPALELRGVGKSSEDAGARGVESTRNLEPVAGDFHVGFHFRFSFRF
jgi:hypothetical protein